MSDEHALDDDGAGRWPLSRWQRTWFILFGLVLLFAALIRGLWLGDTSTLVAGVAVGGALLILGLLGVQPVSIKYKDLEVLMRHELRREALAQEREFARDGTEPGVLERTARATDEAEPTAPRSIQITVSDDLGISDSVHAVVTSRAQRRQAYEAQIERVLRRLNWQVETDVPVGERIRARLDLKITSADAQTSVGVEIKYLEAPLNAPAASHAVATFAMSRLPRFLLVCDEQPTPAARDLLDRGGVTVAVIPAGLSDTRVAEQLSEALSAA